MDKKMSWNDMLKWDHIKVQQEVFEMSIKPTVDKLEKYFCKKCNTFHPDQYKCGE